jgi:hypothetical protein
LVWTFGRKASGFRLRFRRSAALSSPWRSKLTVCRGLGVQQPGGRGEADPVGPQIPLALSGDLLVSGKAMPGGTQNAKLKTWTLCICVCARTPG